MEVINLKRIPLMVIAHVMQKIQDTPATEMVWHKGKIISTTLPSSFMTF